MNPFAMPAPPAWQLPQAPDPFAWMVALPQPTIVGSALRGAITGAACGALYGWIRGRDIAHDAKIAAAVLGAVDAAWTASLPNAAIV